MLERAGNGGEDVRSGDIDTGRTATLLAYYDIAATAGRARDVSVHALTA